MTMTLTPTKELHCESGHSQERQKDKINNGDTADDKENEGKNAVRTTTKDDDKEQPTLCVKTLYAAVRTTTSAIERDE